MKKFYFVGGPRTGQAEEFFRRLNQIGETLLDGASILTPEIPARHSTS